MLDYHLLFSLGEFLQVRLVITSSNNTSTALAKCSFIYIVDGSSRVIASNLLFINS
jgi:hypothetical protein